MSRQSCDCMQRQCCCTVREATCARGAVSYRLHSSTSLSLTVWGWLAAQWQHLALCFPFVKIWLHWITITTSTSCPLRKPTTPHPTPLLPQTPSTHSLPPVRSLQLDPLNLPNYLSSGHATVALTRQHILHTGQSRGAKGTSTGLPDYLPRRTLSLWYFQPFTAKFNTLGHSKITETILHVRKCRKKLPER